MDKIETPMLALINGIIVTETHLLEGYVILIKNEYIYSILPKEDFRKLKMNLQIYDCHYNYILPGLIDMHSDVIENLISPRKGIMFDYHLAIHELDRQLLSQGITTIYHSISIASSTICNRERTMGVAEMLLLGRTINQYENDLLINHRFHARLELNCIEAYKDICQMLLNKEIHELSFMDHTPGQGQYVNMKMFDLEIQEQYGNISLQEKMNIIETCRNKPQLSKNQIDTLIINAHNMKIPVAWHDVDSQERLNWMEKVKISICEFPIYNSIADQAHKKGFHCVVGAPNILLNRSHQGNTSATYLIETGNANIICSDYYTAGLLPAIFKLHQEHNIPLYKVVGYATLQPAKALKIEKKYGSITVGKIADLLVVRVSNRKLPEVIQTIVKGKIILTYN